MNQTLKIDLDSSLPWECVSIRRNAYGEWHFKTPESKMGSVYLIADSFEKLMDRVKIESKRAIRKISKKVGKV